MNILFITHYDGFYGSSRCLLNLIEGLQKYNINPFVVIPKEGKFTDALAEFNIPFRITPVPWWMTNKPYSIKLKLKIICNIFQSVKSIRKLVKEWKIDLIYTNTTVISVGRLVSILESIPHIWHIREFGDLDFSLKFILPKRLSLGFIKSSHAIICMSNAIREHYFKQGNRRVHVINDGMFSEAQINTFLSLKNKANRQDSYTFAIVGSITPKKGQESAIKAIAELVNGGFSVKLIIAGSGEKAWVDYCVQLVNTLNITNYVVFKGFIDNPYEVYFSSDCLLMCSENEGFGLVSVEAMFACLPVIGKNSGGTRDIVVNGETGFLYNTFNELVDSMTTIVQNPELGRSLGMAGWKRAKEIFTTDIFAENTYQIINSVIKKK